MPDESKIRELHARLDDLAPYPQSAPVPVQELIAYFGAEVQVHAARYADSSRRARAAGGTPDTSIVALISASYAAGRALLQLHHAAPETAGIVASEIWDACCDGHAAEAAWGWTGGRAEAVAMLAGEIAAALEGTHRDRALALAAKWEAEAEEMRREFAGDSSSLAALAGGHKEANLLRDRAAELRAAMDAEARVA